MHMLPQALMAQRGVGASHPSYGFLTSLRPENRDLAAFDSEEEIENMQSQDINQSGEGMRYILSELARYRYANSAS